MIDHHNGKCRFYNAPSLFLGRDCFQLEPHRSALLPAIGADACHCYDCSAGKCLPGDPVPLLLYPPELSITGALAEGAAIAVLEVLFP